jgi:hypothetical protein
VHQDLDDREAVVIKHRRQGLNGFLGLASFEGLVHEIEPAPGRKVVSDELELAGRLPSQKQTDMNGEDLVVPRPAKIGFM